MAGAPPPQVPAVRARGRWARLALTGLAVAGTLVTAAPAGKAGHSGTDAHQTGTRQAGSRQAPRTQRPIDFAADQRRTEGGVLIGTVIDSETGRGLPRARVTLTGPAGSFAIATDPLGRYYFVALPDGDYEIAADLPGYADGRFGRLRAGGPPQRLTLARSEWRVDANITMWRLGAIEGAVLDELGEGIAGMRVHALRREHDDAGPVIADIETTVTDDRGAFRIAELVPGNYLVMTPSVQITVPLDVMNRIAETGSGGGGITALLGILDPRGPDEPGSPRFSAENLVPLSEDFASLRGRLAEPPPPGEDGVPYVYPMQYYPSTDMPSLAMAIDLEPGMQFFNAVFALRPVPARTVQGVVMGPAGPTSNQLLRLVPDTGEDFGAGFEVARTVSNLEGEFTFLDVPAGRYVLEVRDAESFNQLSPRPFVSVAEASAEADGEPIPRRVEQWWARMPINVFSEDVNDLTVTMQPTRSIVGQVRFESTGARPRTSEVDEIRVSLKPAGGGRAGVPGVRTRATGSFALHGLWPLSYYVDMALPPGWSVASVDGQGRDLTTMPLDAAMGSGDIAVTVRLTNAQTLIRGTVRDPGGRTVDDRIVVVLPADTRERPPLRTREVRLTSEGEYFVTGLPPGRYQVMALTGEEEADWRAPGGLSRFAAQAQTLTLGAGEQRVQDLRVGR